MQGISGVSGQFIVLINSTSADRNIINQSGSASAGNKIYTGTGADFIWKQNSAVFLQEAEGDWYIVGGAGGAAIGTDTLNGTSLTLGNDGLQKVRYNGGSDQTLSALNFTDLPDGGRLIITGSSNTNTLTIPTTLTNVQMNGEIVLYQYSTIEFIKDDTQLIEVSRNGI